MTSNANTKALNAIFCGVSLDEFHRISHITVAKEAWQILETTYEGTKKVKDTKGTFGTLNEDYNKNCNLYYNE